MTILNDPDDNSDNDGNHEVMTIAIKTMMRCRRNKLMNTFSGRLDFAFINIG